MKRGRRGLALGSTLLLAACNALVGLDESFVLEGPDAAAPADGGEEAAVEAGPLPLVDSGTDADAPSDATPDGGVDTGTDAANDAGLDAPLDAPAETGADTGTDAGFVCPTGGTVLFCETFENAASLPPAGWTRIDPTGGLSLVANGGKDGTRGLRAVSSATTNAVLWRNLGSNLPNDTRYVVDLDFRLASSTVQYVVLGTIQVTVPGNSHDYGLAAYTNTSCLGGTNRCFDENFPGEEEPNHSFGGSVRTDSAWHHARITLLRDATGYRGMLLLDGTSDLDPAGQVYITAAPTLVELGIGAFFRFGSGEVEVTIDNVVAARL